VKDYNKTLRYRKHYELYIPYFYFNVGIFLAIPSFITIAIIKLFSIPYFPWLKASDFIFLILFSMYLFYLRPQIYRGKIKAYYRRSYKKIEKAVQLYVKIGIIGALRFIIMGILDILKTKNITAPFLEMFHPVSAILTVLSAFLFLYLVFYQDKYVSIEEYSNRINYKIKELKMNDRRAIEEFLEEKDKEYNIKEFHGMYYDISEAKKYNSDKKKQNITENKKEEIKEEPLRRKSRIGENNERN